MEEPARRRPRPKARLLWHVSIRHPEHENHERWLISYADFITLLFAFFVVMFASSQTDKSKAQQVSDSVNSALNNGATRPEVRTILGGTIDENASGNAMMKGPGVYGKVLPPKAEVVPSSKVVTDLMPSMKFLNQSLANEIKDGKVEVHIEARGLMVSLRQSAFFPSGGDELPRSRTRLWRRSPPCSVACRILFGWKATPTRFRSTATAFAAIGNSPPREVSRCSEVLSGRFGIPRTASGFPVMGIRRR